MEFFILTWNIHRKKEFLINLYGILANTKADTVYVALQEAHEFIIPWFIQKYFIKGFMKSHKYCVVERFCGLVTIIMSNYKLKVTNKFILLEPYYFNKGAIITKIVINFVTVLMINLHLMSGEKNESARIEQMKEIIRVIEGNFHYIFVCGDFNTRVDTKEIITNFDFNSLLENKKNAFSSQFLQNLKSADQMNNFKKTLSLDEFEVNFPPTYKFRGNRFREDRTPSWCDRILFKSVNEMECIFYKSNHLVDFGDHKPVMKLLNIRDGVGLKTMYKRKRKEAKVFPVEVIRFIYNNFIVVLYIVFVALCYIV